MRASHRSAGTATTGGRDLSFWERLPDRLTVFAVGFAGGTAVGLIAGAILHASLTTAFGYSMVLLGAVCLLGGGLTGGGYSVYGIGQGVGRNHYMRGDHNRLVGEGLRAGYDRPAADPGAFWMVVGGALYLAVGLAAVVLGS
jgi:hypothetical protein